MNIKTL